MSATMTNAGLSIRGLTLDELPLCYPFGAAFYQEMKLPGTFSPAVFRANWEMYLTTYPFPAVMLGLWKDGVLIGGLGAVAAPDPNDGRLTAQEFFLYVDPAHRQGTGLLRLLRAFQDWCYLHRAAEGRLVHLLTAGETYKTVKLDKVYRKLGGIPTEVCYVFPIEAPPPIWED